MISYLLFLSVLRTAACRQHFEEVNSHLRLGRTTSRRWGHKPGEEKAWRGLGTCGIRWR
jgi:hypothetical protein